MQIKLILAIAAATFTGYAAAQKCAAQNILDECLKNGKAVASNCDQTDYKCLCQAHTALLECYINCPQDPTKGTQESQVSSWCISAGGGNTSSSVAPSATSSSTDAPAPSSSADPEDEEDGASDDEEETPSGTEDEDPTSSSTDEPASSNTDSTGAGSTISPAMSFGVLAGLAAAAGAFL